MKLDLKEEIKAFEAVYQPSKEVAYCFGSKCYVQLSREEDHSEIADHANHSLEVWQAAKAQAALEIEELKAQLDSEKSLRSMSEHLNKVKQDEINELKASAVLDGFVAVPVKEIKTWYLDESENIYREDLDWLCDIPNGEVVEVERRISYELNQNPVFAAIQWDDENDDVGYYETFENREDAEKAATHCKDMIEAAQEQGNDCE